MEATQEADAARVAASEAQDLHTKLREDETQRQSTQMKISLRASGDARKSISGAVEKQRAMKARIGKLQGAVSAVKLSRKLGGSKASKRQSKAAKQQSGKAARQQGSKAARQQGSRATRRSSGRQIGPAGSIIF